MNSVLLRLKNPNEHSIAISATDVPITVVMFKSNQICICVFEPIKVRLSNKLCAMLGKIYRFIVAIIVVVVLVLFWYYCFGFYYVANRQCQNRLFFIE